MTNTCSKHPAMTSVKYTILWSLRHWNRSMQQTVQWILNYKHKLTSGHISAVSKCTLFQLLHS